MSDTLKDLLSEVDWLENALKDLDREIQKEQGVVHHLNQLIQRDEDHITETNKDMVEHNADIKQWTERGKSLTSAIESCNQSKQLLSQMAAQSKSRLETERMVTVQHKRDMRGKVETFKMKVEKENEKIMKVPKYRQLIELEELTERKRIYMESLKKGGINCDSLSIRNQSVKLAEVWLAVNKKSEDLSLAEEEKLKIQDEITLTLSEKNLSREDILMELGDEIRHEQYGERDRRIEDDSHSMNFDPIQIDQATNMERDTPMKIKPGGKNPYHEERGKIDKAGNNQGLLDKTNYLGGKESPLKIQPSVRKLPNILKLSTRSEIPHYDSKGKDVSNKMSQPTKLCQFISSQTNQESSSSSRDKLFTFPSKPIQSIQKSPNSDVASKQSTTHLSSYLPPTPTEQMSSYVPPTPKTKMQHLKLCSSLLGSSKKKEVNTILVSDVENNKMLELLSTCSKPREADNSGDQLAGQSSRNLLTFNMADEGNKREKKVIDDGFVHSSGKTMEHTEDVDMSDAGEVGSKMSNATSEIHLNTKQNNSAFKQKTPLTIDSLSVKTNPIKDNFLFLSHPGLLSSKLQPSIQKNYSVQSFEHRSDFSKSSTTENIDKNMSEINTPRKSAQVSAASIDAAISERPLYYVETQPIRTPPTNKKLPRTTLLSISPGTALRPEKRNQVLQQLLESPVSVHRVKNQLLESPMPVPREDNLFTQGLLPVPKVVKKKSQETPMPVSRFNNQLEKISLLNKNTECLQGQVPLPQKNNQYLARPESGSKINRHCLESSGSVLQDISQFQESSISDPKIDSSIIEPGIHREEKKSNTTKDKNDGFNFFNPSPSSSKKDEKNHPGVKNTGSSAFSFFDKNETGSTEASFSLFGDAEEVNDDNEGRGFDFNFGSSFGNDNESASGGSFF